MQIIKIPARKRILRTAAYCRVSTDKSMQHESFEAQVNYYTDLINSNPSWTMAGIYADEGLSGTSTKRRAQFNRMIEDARMHRIDLILVKSVSRFARNSVDCNNYVRELKRLNVEVRFERENISTMDPSAEFIFNINAIVAQEESRSISKNVRWRIERDFAQGKHFYGSGQVLGYDVIDRRLVPNNDAWIIRRIFDDCLNGMSLAATAEDLNRSGAKRLRSKNGFMPDTVHFILHNPIYAGDLLLQKRAPADYLTKRPQTNIDYTSYYVKDDHTPIIEREVWDEAQRISREKSLRDGIVKNSRSHFLRGKLFCGKCGSVLVRRSFKSKAGESYRAWCCREKQNGCKNPYIRETALMDQLSRILGKADVSGDDVEKVQRISVEDGKAEVFFNE